MKKVLATALATLSLLSVPTHADETEFYTMSMSITDNGEVIGEPELTGRLGEQFEVQIEPGDGRVYHAFMTFTQADNDTIQMAYSFDLVTPSVGNVTLEREVTLTPSVPVRIEYGNKTPGVRPFRAEISFSPA